MSGWLSIIFIFAWNEVTLEVDLSVESIFAVDETSSFLNTVPFLGTLTVTMSPPLRLSETLLILFWFWDLSCKCEAVWMMGWLSVTLVP